MKLLNSIFIVAVMSVTLVACNSNSGDSDETIQIDTAHPPVMSFEEVHYEFDTIAEGEKMTHVFEFTNTGGSTLLIEDAYSSCGCTVPSFPEKPIQPGEKGKIKVVFDSSHKGNQKIHKQIKIISNTYPEKATVISIGGVVE